MSAVEVLALDNPTLTELAATANREHEATQTTAVSMLDHAIAAGEALIAARKRVPAGGWDKWLNSNVTFERSMCFVYMRLAHFKDALYSSNEPLTSINQARKLLSGMPGLYRGRPTGVTEEHRETIRSLFDQGFSRAAIADQLGVSRTTVQRIVDPDYAEAQRERQRLWANRQNLAKRALREQEREQEIKRAVRKTGAATQEAWSMAERFQDVIAQAQRETEDREARAALSRAGEHYRKMRDEIVRALGVT